MTGRPVRNRKGKRQPLDGARHLEGLMLAGKARRLDAAVVGHHSPETEIGERCKTPLAYRRAGRGRNRSAPTTRSQSPGAASDQPERQGYPSGTPHQNQPDAAPSIK